MSCDKGERCHRRPPVAAAASPLPARDVFSMDALSEQLSETCADSGGVDSVPASHSSHRSSPSRIPLYVANGLQPHHSPLHSRTHPPSAFCGQHPVHASRLVPDAILRQQQHHNRTKHGRNLRQPQPSSSADTSSSSRRTSCALSEAGSAVPFDAHTGMRYEDYMPLCQLQKALKKGEVLEVSLLP